MAKKRNCICCQKEYEYCPNCGEYSSYPTWMAEFDTETCKEIFNIVSAYNTNLVGENEVKAVVKKFDVTDFNQFVKGVSDTLKKACNKVEEPKKDEPSAPAKTEEKKVFDKAPFIKDKFKKNNKEVVNTEE